jgi:four helix bundle protein
MTNIAEGFDRSSRREFIHFVNIARSSASKLKSHIYLAREPNYITIDENDHCMSLMVGVSKQLAGFHKYLKSTRDLKKV